MKKVLTVFILLMSITLVSCNKTGINLDRFNKLVDEFTILESEREVYADFSLPLSIEDENEEIKIKWEIVKGDLAAEIVSNNVVKITRPEHNYEDVIVKLKASFEYKEYKEVKYFEFTVIKEEKENIELKDAYVLYINIDGFAKYYYDIAVERGLVNNLERLRSDGIFFDDLRNEFPSITNPMQNMIVSGGTSAKTENVYRYYDKVNDIVIQQGRENKADTLYKSGARSNIQMASIRHFTAENILSPTDLNKLYVNTPDGEVSNLENRFKQAIKLVKGEEFINGSLKQKVDNVPRLLTLYVDEPDGFGHNDSPRYDKKLAKTEEERIDNVLDAITQIDYYINELVKAYKERGIYDKTAIFVTTDHGMTPFGHPNDNFIESLSGKYSKTKWPALRDALKAINSEYKFEYVKPGEKPKSDTTVVGVSTGLQMNITFKNHRLTNDDLNSIKETLEKEEYVYEVLTRKDLSERGIWRGANIDLIVVPKERYHFHGVNSPNTPYRVRAQHDTTLDSSTQIYGMIFGGLVKNNQTVNETVRVLSFGTTMADILGLKLRDANISALDILNKEGE